jgi:4-amino-4-deoxy-L-arabinose transferase-like glycosyltransferase
MTKRRGKTGLYAILALIAGLVLRLCYVARAPRIDGDTLIYGNIAKNWMQHGVYGFATTAKGLQPTLIRLPGYPLFLAACFRVFGVDHYVAVMCVQGLLDLFTCLLIAALARRLFGQRAGLIALWLSALCPFTAAYVAAPLTEILTLFTIALTFYSVERWRSAGLGFNRWLWITAVTMAYSVLLRPEQGMLPAVVVPAMIWMAWKSTQKSPQKSPQRITLPQNLWPVAVAAICVVLPLLPWAARNWHTFHVIQPLAPRSASDPGEFIPRGFQRWYRTWAIDFASTEQVYWNYDSTDLRLGDLPTRAFDSEEQYVATASLLSDYNQKDNATRPLDDRFEAIAEQRIHANPIRYYIGLPLARLVNMLFRPRTEMMQIGLDWWNWHEYRSQTLLAYGMAALNFSYFALGAIGLCLWWRAGWGVHGALAAAMTAFVLLRCALLLTLDNSEPRYTLEFFPLLFVWGSYVFGRRARISS